MGKALYKETLYMTTKVATKARSSVDRDPDYFPFISTELIEALEARYPELCILPEQPINEAMFYSGKRDLVRVLRIMYESQDDSSVDEPPF